MKDSKACEYTFEEIFLEAVDESLSILGDSCKQAFYIYLEKTYKVNRLSIPCEIEGFTRAIEEIFGFGAKLLQIQIMKNLHEKTGYLKILPGNALNFTEYVETTRKLHPSEGLVKNS